MDPETAETIRTICQTIVILGGYAWGVKALTRKLEAKADKAELTKTNNQVALHTSVLHEHHRRLVTVEAPKR